MRRAAAGRRITGGRGWAPGRGPPGGRKRLRGCGAGPAEPGAWGTAGRGREGAGRGGREPARGLWGRRRTPVAGGRPGLFSAGCPAPGGRAPGRGTAAAARGAAAGPAASGLRVRAGPGPRCGARGCPPPDRLLAPFPSFTGCRC